MTPSQRLFACASALLVLPAAAVHAADTPAVAVVREFLADRAAGKSAEAYALLSSELQRGLTENQFAASVAPPAATLKEKADPLYALSLLLTDTRNTQGYTFILTGPDPANPNAALVRVTPPATAAGVPVTVLHLAVASDPVAQAPRLDMLETLKATDPKIFAEVANRAKRAASQSNLKQIGLGIIQYEQDHDEYTPDAAKWIDETMPYIKSTEPFHDPSLPASKLYGYAYNSALSHKGIALFEVPSSTVMVFESTKSARNAADAGLSVPRPGRYSGGTDYLFTDGHVKWFPDGTKLSFKLSGK